MKWIFAFLLFFLPIAETHGKDDLEVQIFGRYGYNATRLNLAQNLKATYSGWDTGGKAVIKIAGKKEYGLGISFGLDNQSLDNTANTSTQQENIESRQFSLTAKFYALNLYVGGGILHNTFDLTYKPSAGTATTTSYSGVGMRLETGIDVEVGKLIIFTPHLNYDILDVQTKGDSNVKRLNSFGIGAGLGFQL
jgi:outer membrane autotransporter protein